MKRTPLKRGRRKTYGTPKERLAFKQEVLRLDGGCVMRHDESEMGWFCEGLLQAAHVIPKQRLKQIGFNAEQIYDVGAAMCLCERHHRRNDSGRERVPYSLIPARCIKFARDFRFPHLIDRLYGEDPSPTERAEASSS